MNGPSYLGEDVALFIDWENFKISLATGRRHPNVSALKEEVSNLGRVVVAKAYADWVTRSPELKGASQFINDPPALYAAGIEPVYVPTRLSTGSASSPGPTRTVRVKNSVDVKMTADCIECAHSYPNIGTYVLVSGDSDFIHVVNTLRTMGKRVVVIGVSWATSRRLADQVDGLILYDVDIDADTPSETVAAGNGQAPARSDSGAGAGSRLELGEVIRAIEEIVRLERQAGGTPLLTSIKQRLMRRFPGFDEKKLGFSGFKKLMDRAAQEGNIKLITAGLVDWATMADEPVPEDGSLEQPVTAVAPATVSRGRRRRSSKPGSASEARETVEAPGTAEEMATADGSPEEGLEPGSPPPGSIDLGAVVADNTTGLDLPAGPGDGLDAQRVADLIIMAEFLEHREGVSHVAFNFLAAEVCKNLEDALAAEDEGITRRWAQAYSRTYVSRMLRALSDGNLFQRGWHSWRDEGSGQQKRRRTFNLDRGHPVVQQVLKAHWGPATDAEYAGVAVEAPVEVEHAPPPEMDDPVRPAIPFLSRLFRPRR